MFQELVAHRVHGACKSATTAPIQLKLVYRLVGCGSPCERYTLYSTHKVAFVAEFAPWPWPKGGNLRTEPIGRARASGAQEVGASSSTLQAACAANFLCHRFRRSEGTNMAAIHWLADCKHPTNGTPARPRQFLWPSRSLCSVCRHYLARVFVLLARWPTAVCCNAKSCVCMCL